MATNDVLISVEELAAKAGTSPITITLDEQGFQCPGPDIQQAISLAVGFPIEVIWPDSKPQVARAPLPLHIT